MPAIKKSLALANRAVAFGFEWPDATAILEQIRSECSEIQVEITANDRKKLEDEVGDLLHAAIDLCRFLQIDPEACLDAANLKFEDRLNRMIKIAQSHGHTDLNGFDVKTLLSFWNLAKIERDSS